MTRSYGYGTYGGGTYGNPESSVPLSSYPGSQYADAVRNTRSLLAYWRLGEQAGATVAVDDGGNFNGAYVGSPTLGATGGLVGDRDTAVIFGSGSMVQVNEVVTVVSPSVECLVDLSGVARHGTWFKVGDAGTGAGFGMGGATLNTDGFNMLVTFDGIGTVTGPSLSALVGWHQLGFSIDSNLLVQFYIDGDFFGENFMANPMITPTGHSYLAQSFNGALDEVSVYGFPPDVAVMAQHARVGRGEEQRPSDAHERRYTPLPIDDPTAYGGGAYGDSTYGGTPAITGTINVGPIGKSLDLAQVIQAGGWVTADPYVQGALRGIGLFTEGAV